VVTDVVNGANVGMVQGGSGLCFTLETGQSLRIPGQIIGKEFEGDKPMQASVFRLVDHAHAPTTELFDDAVVGNGLPDEGRGVRHLADMLGGGQKQVNEESSHLSEMRRVAAVLSYFWLTGRAVRGGSSNGGGGSGVCTDEGARCAFQGELPP
jgi:hypothetical protein